MLLVSDPTSLARFSEQGLAFDRITTSADRDVLRATLASDLALHARRDPQSGTGLRHPHRLFDVRWLNDSRFRFELVGIVNRIDRRVFHPETCGETRLVYRLAYRAERASSRMPMTVNVVFFQRDEEGDCVRVLSRWQRPIEELAGEGAPLSSSALAPSLLKSIEMDVQSVRWPATVRPDLAGHAEYLLRVFSRDSAGVLRPSVLENQPDVARLRRDAALRGELLAWITDRETLAAIDRGTARLPDRFLATSAISVAPHGLARPSNRPFRELFEPDQLRTIDLSGLRTVLTPSALLRRLDGLSCTGCHHSRSLAGFHLLGDEAARGQIDALASGISPHLQGEIVRRSAYARAILAGQTPDEMRDYAEHEGSVARIGAHCGLGDPSFAEWTCGEGMRCARAGDDEVGVCVGAERAQIGDACELVAIGRTSRQRDRGTHTFLPCSECDLNRVGFPGGLCTGPCTAASSSDVACGAIPALRPFNDCIARREPFEHCLASTSAPAALLACDRERPCRDDYVCVRTASGAGACIPPYFLFQLRVDGHPL